VKAVTVGDSVAWGQGLREEEKFDRRLAEAVAARLGRGEEGVELDRRAHSGAVIREDEVKPRLDPARHPHWREVPWGSPTAMEQASGPADPEVELAVCVAGLNDFGVTTVMNPDTDRHALAQDVRRNCYVDVKALLRRMRETWPNAVIVQCGYFAPLSELSRPTALVAAVSMLGALQPVGTAVARHVARQNRRFARLQLHWLRLAVAERHADPATRGPGIVFAHPAFGPANSVAAPDPLLFSPSPPESLDDWSRSFAADPLATALRVAPDDPVAEERRDACAAYDDRLREGRADVDPLQCRIAAIGHPNPDGARRYAEAAEAAWARNRRVAVADDLGRLWGGPGLRGPIRRYGLAAGRRRISLRAAWQHMRVDSLAVEIRTPAERFAGTNHRVELELADGRRFHLNPKVFDGDLFDDFAPGAKTLYVVDPAEGDPSARMHLGDVDRLRLTLSLTADVPEGDWKPAEIGVQLNGVEVRRETVDQDLSVTVLDPEDSWTAGWPRSA